MKELFEVLKLEWKKIGDSWLYEVGGRALQKLHIGDLVQFKQDCTYEIVSIESYGRQLDEIDASMGAQILLKEKIVTREDAGRIYLHLYGNG